MKHFAADRNLEVEKKTQFLLFFFLIWNILPFCSLVLKVWDSKPMNFLPIAMEILWHKRESTKKTLLVQLEVNQAPLGATLSIMKGFGFTEHFIINILSLYVDTCMINLS